MRSSKYIIDEGKADIWSSVRMDYEVIQRPLDVIPLKRLGKWMNEWVFLVTVLIDEQDIIRNYIRSA